LLDWRLNFNYWTGATRQDFVVGGVKWCPASRTNVSSSLPWGLLGGSENATLLGKLDCVALKVGQTKTNFTTSFFGKLLMRNCSNKQMIACRVTKFGFIIRPSKFKKGKSLVLNLNSFFCNLYKGVLLMNVNNWTFTTKVRKIKWIV